VGGVPVRLNSLFLSLALLCDLAFSNPFLSPRFEHLELEVLSKAYNALKKDNPSSFEFILLELFLGEIHRWKGKIHQSGSFLKKAEERCDLFSNPPSFKDPESSRIYLACAIVYADNLVGANAFRRLRLVQKSQASLYKGLTTSENREEQLYAKGRVYYLLPPSMGQDFGKSLLAFQILRRLKPKLSSPNFWLARIYQLQGNEKKAKVFYKKALAFQPADRRALFFFPKGEFYRAKRHVDEASSGFNPAIFYLPTQGVGLSLVYWDKRLFDTFRSASIHLRASTKQTYVFGLEFEDDKSISGLKIESELTVHREIEEFHGLGISSPSNKLSDLTNLKLVAALGIRRDIGRYWYVGGGWRVAHHQLQQAPGVAVTSLPILDLTSSFHMGPYLVVGFDSRDSHALAYRGVHASVKTYLARRAWGSERDFEVWRLFGESNLALNLRHHLCFQIGTVLTSGEVPFSVYPRLGGSFTSLGVRRGRFQDRNLLLGQAEYRWRVWNPLSVAVFGSAGTVAATLSDLFTSPYKLGVGGALLLHLSHHRKQNLRVEIGHFGGDTSLAAMAGTEL